MFAAWWETNAGEVVHELLDDGQILHYSQLHRRTRPKRPKDPREDRRWTDDEVLGWPISHEEFERWARRRHWQFARTMPQNPHEYTHRAWGHEETFLRVVLHLREHGRQEVYGGDLYTYYVANGFKHWTMGADLMSTILINRKPVGQDEGNEETEERPGRVPQPDLFRLGPRGEGVTERTETAYHEAGHAVALYALGFDLGDVSIVASEEHLGLIGIPIDEALADRLDKLKFSEDGETFIVRRIAGVFAGVRAVEILRVLLASIEVEFSERRERTALTDTTHAWLLSLRKRLDEVQENTREGFEKRKQLVGLLVESISLGKSQQEGRAEVQITYRFGPPPVSDTESEEDVSMPVVKNGSRS